MLRVSLTFIILLLALSYCYADGLPAEEVEKQAKERKLEKVAERFKAETGFRGEIKYNTEKMLLGFFDGKFADIRITADADTASFRVVFEQILDKILPYTDTNRQQLSKSKITHVLSTIETLYYQQINGYRVDGVGFIAIAYDPGRNGFRISNGTVELPIENTIPVITYEEAAIIYFDNVKEKEAMKKHLKKRTFLGLRYCNIYNEREGDTRSEYRLCWVGGVTRTIYIDAQTGQVYKIVNNTK